MAGLDIENAFEIDAAKLLAKLHRGACEVQKMKFFNAGVIDDANITPAECEKSKISFNTKLEQIDLGVIAKPEIECKLKYTVEDILEKATAPGGKEEQNTKITENPNQKMNEAEVPSFLSFLREDDGKKPDDSKDKNADEDVDIDPFQVPKNIDDKVKAEVEKMVKENQDELKKKIDSELKYGAECLRQYMKEFAGEAESKKITEKSVVAVYLPDDADPTKFEYKDGTIEGLSEKDRIKAWHEIIRKNSEKKVDTDTYVIKNMCVKMSYTLNMEA